MEVPQVTASSSVPLPRRQQPHFSPGRDAAAWDQTSGQLHGKFSGSIPLCSLQTLPASLLGAGAHVENPVQVLAQAVGWPEAKAGLCTQQKHRSQGAPPDSGH